MRQDEKLSYLIIGAIPIYQSFLLATNAATINTVIEVMKSMKTDAKLVTPTITTIVFEAQIIELKD